MPSKKYYFFWFLSIFLVLGFLINEFRPLTFGEARRLAIASMQRDTKGDVIKYSFLKGPEPTTPPSGVPYAFEWTYGQGRYYVWVEKNGKAHVDWDGDRKRFEPPEY